MVKTKMLRQRSELQRRLASANVKQIESQKLSGYSRKRWVGEPF